MWQLDRSGGGGGGSGDVVGPGSATDGHLVLFDGPSGKLIKDGGPVPSGSTPGGANTQIQFNDSGVFAGDPELTWDKTANTLTVKATINFAGTTSGAVSVKGQAVAGTWTLTLPAIPGTSGQFLSTDGTGIATWASQSSDIPLSYLDTDVTLAANSDVKVPSQKAAKTYIDNLIAAANAMVYKGVIDASTNPNYPAADAGWVYIISVAGKIGGASGINVELGDMILCNTDGTASGDQATVGAFWNIIQKNLDGAVIGPASSVSGNVALFSGTSGKLLVDGGPYSGIGGSTTQVQFNNGGVYAGDPGFTWTSATDTLTIGEAASATGKIAFKGLTSGTVTLSTADVAGTWTMKLPATAGTANQLLQTDGSGNTTWATVSAGSGDVVGPGSAVDSNFAQFDTTTGKLIKDSGLSFDTDPTLAANSNTRIASQAAIKAYADQLIGTANAMVYKGVIDASTNPNYPAADAGWTYLVSVAGKIGGASGINVEVGDMFVCTTDGTASGNQATVGAFWNVIQKNLDGAVIGPASSTNGNLALFDGTTGKLLKDGGPPSPGSISIGVANKIPYYNTTTTLIDTSAGSATDGMFWDNTQRTTRIGTSNTNPGLSTRSLMVGQSLVNNEGNNGSIMFGFTNTHNSGSGGHGSLIGGSSNTTQDIWGAIVSGQSNNVNEAQSAVVVGNSNTVRNSSQSVVFGTSNQARATRSLVGGIFNRLHSANTELSGSTVNGSYNHVYGSFSHALGGNSTANINRVPASYAFLTGGDDSGSSLHCVNSPYSQVEGKTNMAGYRSFTWTRANSAATTITISCPTEFVAPREWTTGAIARFFELTGGDDVFSGTVVCVDTAVTFVSFAAPTLTVTIASAATLGTRTAGRVVIKDGAEYANASGFGAHAYQQGQHSQSNGYFGTQGDAQTSILTMRKNTLNSTPALLLLDVPNSRGLYIPPHTTWGFTITVVGKKTGASTSAFYKFEGLITRLTGAPAISGTPAVAFQEDNAAWDCTIAAGGTDTLDITVTGEAASVYWVARVELTEVTNP